MNFLGKSKMAYKHGRLEEWKERKEGRMERWMIGRLRVLGKGLIMLSFQTS